MIINYVPGLALRFFPGLSREPYDAVDKYLAANSKIAIFTGTAPTENELWALGNFNDYVTANQDKLVYQETTQLEFSYDGYKHKRVIQKFPVDSTSFNPLIDIIPQDLVTKPDAIPTPNSLYALVYCPDKDTTLNIPGNDLIMLIPEVGSGSSDFCSISNHNFKKDDSLYFRNLTIALFQGYQITDTLITEKQDDPDNPGSQIDVVIDTKKSVYINKNWGNRISEAYRDCFVSRNTFLTKYFYTSGVLATKNIDVINATKLLSYAFCYNDYYLYTGPTGASINYMNFKLRKYNKLSSKWENTNLETQYSMKMYNGFICNESMINLINDINNKALTKSYPSLDTLVGLTLITDSAVRFQLHVAYLADAKDRHLTADLLPGMLAKHCFNASHLSQDFKDSLTQLLIELGHDEAMINSAFKSLVPIDFDVTKYSSLYNKDANILTIQNNAPAKLKTRFKNSIHNPTNEKLYIFLPRYIARSGIENELLSDVGSGSYHYSSASSVSYPDTQKVLEGEVVDYNTPRIRQQDFTAISIGKTGNGETDLEFDLIDVIDYIDSFTTMVKIPNKF